MKLLPIHDTALDDSEAARTCCLVKVRGKRGICRNQHTVERRNRGNRLVKGPDAKHLVGDKYFDGCQLGIQATLLEADK